MVRLASRSMHEYIRSTLRCVLCVCLHHATRREMANQFLQVTTPV